MATIYKVLGQVAATPTIETPLYTVPALKSAVVSSITVANRSSTVVSNFRISIAVGGAVTSTKDYIYYGVLIGQNDTFIATVGLTLSAGDELRVWSSTGSSLSFQAFGSEIS